MLEIVSQYWGIIVAVLGLIGFAIYDYEKFKSRVVSLIFIAEEKSRELCLETGQKKFEWVVQNGYKYLPAVLKLVLSEELFKALVQHIFDKVVKWAEKQELPGR